MYYKLPTTLYCEKDCISRHASDISSYGQYAYIITGRHSAKTNGSLSDILNALKAHNINYQIYDRINENPSIENIMEAVSLSDKKCDFVIGIGGGSALDASKAIAMLLANPDKDENCLYDNSKKLPHLPIVTIPTTCGTGSEITPYSILTIHKERTKRSLPHKIYPSLALIDPMYLNSAPDTIIRNTAIDALGHLIESYINTNATLVSRMFCIQGLNGWQNIYRILTDKTRNYESYEKLMMTSAFAGMAISHTGTCLPHGMSYGITYEHNIPHGKAVGTFLGAFVDNADSDMRDTVFSLCGFKDGHSIHKAITEFCGTVTLTSKEVNTAVSGMLSNTKKLKSCPYSVDEKVLREMYQRSVIIQ